MELAPDDVWGNCSVALNPYNAWYGAALNPELLCDEGVKQVCLEDQDEEIKGCWEAIPCWELI